MDRLTVYQWNHRLTVNQRNQERDWILIQNENKDPATFLHYHGYKVTLRSVGQREAITAKIKLQTPLKSPAALPSVGFSSKQPYAAHVPVPINTGEPWLWPSMEQSWWKAVTRLWTVCAGARRGAMLCLHMPAQTGVHWWFWLWCHLLLLHPAFPGLKTLLQHSHLLPYCCHHACPTFPANQWNPCLSTAHLGQLFPLTPRPPMSGIISGMQPEPPLKLADFESTRSNPPVFLKFWSTYMHIPLDGKGTQRNRDQ